MKDIIVSAPTSLSAYLIPATLYVFPMFIHLYSVNPMNCCSRVHHLLMRELRPSVMKELFQGHMTASGRAKFQFSLSQSLYI